MQAQTQPTEKKPLTIHQYNSMKREQNDGVLISPVECGNTMIIDDTYRKHARGVRSWMKAKFDNWDQRAKQEKYYQEKEQLEKYKRKQYAQEQKALQEEQEKRRREENERMEKMWKTETARVIVDTEIETEGNDAW